MKKAIWIFIVIFTCVSTIILNAKVFDCFIFFNELDILQIRLEEMYDQVDYFVLVESSETFRGNFKPAYYHNNQHLFSKWADKIIYVYVPETYDSIDAWDREFYQRNQILRGLNKASDDDIILISDVDEIVRSSDMPRLIDSVKNDPKHITGCIQTLYSYYINRRQLGKEMYWHGTKAVSFNLLKTSNPQKIRVSHPTYIIENSGWHFSSIGHENFLQKVKAYSHVENDNQAFMTNLKAFINELELVNIDESFPKYILDNISYFEEIKFIDTNH
ncbi:MAG: hypothetical protein JHC93_08100 [Parachlamydiales bacterium]|nr:hypothetical protein [Parachlamydiales bacterium]